MIKVEWTPCEKSPTCSGTYLLAFSTYNIDGQRFDYIETVKYKFPWNCWDIKGKPIAWAEVPEYPFPAYAG